MSGNIPKRKFSRDNLAIYLKGVKAAKNGKSEDSCPYSQKGELKERCLWMGGYGDERKRDA